DSQHLAQHDPLTELPNRTLFTERLATAMADVSDDHQVPAMGIDLDGFKAVNDTFGHHAGDQVLLEAGRRLTAGVGADGIVARLGGDEFAVLPPQVAGLDA